MLAADGLIAVSPIFNASYSGLFKLFFDVLQIDSLEDMPVMVAATGGTTRHSLALDHALRPLFAYLGALVVPTGVYAAAEDWGRAGDDHAALAGRIQRAGAELATAMAAMPRSPVVDPFDAPPDFASLLPTRPHRSPGQTTDARLQRLFRARSEAPLAARLSARPLPAAPRQGRCQEAKPCARSRSATASPSTA